jgi:hypothetical protein
MNEKASGITCNIIKLDGKKDKRKYAKSGLYRDIDISLVDGRTQAGKTIVGLRRELRDFVGEGTIATELLINQISYKVLKLTLYQAASLKSLKNEEAPHFLPMANSLRLDLVALAGMAGQKKAPDLQGYLDAVYNEKGGKK